MDGSYLFTGLTAGTYQVVVIPLTGFTEFVDPDGVLDNTTSVIITSCQCQPGVDFGYKNTATVCNANPWGGNYQRGNWQWGGYHWTDGH